jgi:hypothetical protein
MAHVHLAGHVGKTDVATRTFHSTSILLLILAKDTILNIVDVPLKIEAILELPKVEFL